MREVPFCQWFALCVRPSAGTTNHPFLGAVPICRECADRFELAVDAHPTASAQEDREPAAGELPFQ